MNRQRHTILQLVALGRISPAEAERMLLAWDIRHEDTWIFLICFALVLFPSHAPLHPLLGVVSAFCSHLPSGLALLGHLFSQLHRLTGGLL